MSGKPICVFGSVKLLLLASALHVAGQSRAYFQQRTDYNIQVRLDDQKHVLHGDISITYHNQSPDTLHEIFFHLYPNAYIDRSTAYARQQLRNGNTDFWFSDDADRGYIDSLDFEVGGVPASLSYDSQNPDIVRLLLPYPLFPGKAAVIHTPFRVKIPQLFSRLGHVGQQYAITQWYPKPAVYDRDGWHPYPYLDQGEFYSEFGNYSVRISLPANYVVGATGKLQNKREQQWLDSLSRQPLPEVTSPKENGAFPPSDGRYKTLHYVAEQVHDFAWFADKRYAVRRSSVTLPRSGRTVETWALFLPESRNPWEKAATYVDSALWYYSQWIGDYPYPQATVVQGNLLEGAGGMEYPMITVVSTSGSARSLDRIIAHEVGHNWFYGILAFDERLHPWMDEGINSYYENRYMEARYGPMRLEQDFPPALAQLLDLRYPGSYVNYLVYHLVASRRADQPASLPADDYTSFNYFAIVYTKVALGFAYLETYLGREALDQLFAGFYERWAFRHPGPEDLKEHFRRHSGKELDWFFDQYLGTTALLDYKLLNEDSSVVIGDSRYRQLRIKNTGGIKGPLTVSGLRGDSVVTTLPVGGFEGTMPVLVPEGDYDAFRIDAAYRMPEINRKNNELRTHGLLRKAEPLRLQWLGSIDNPRRTQLFFTPLIGYNVYDGISPGLALYNYVLTPKKVNVVAVPQFGLHSKRLVGMSGLTVPFHLKSGWARTLELTSHYRTYQYLNNDNDGIRRYWHLHHQLNLYLRAAKPASMISSKLVAKNIVTLQQMPGSDHAQANWFRMTFSSLEFHLNERQVLRPLQFRSELALSTAPDDHTLALLSELNYEIVYPKKKNGLQLRFYGQYPLIKPSTPLFTSQLTATAGLDDIAFEKIYFGRSESSGLWSRQIYAFNDGGMKMRVEGMINGSRLGETYDWLLAGTVKVPLPLFTRLFAFADAGLAPPPPAAPDYNLLQYLAGVGVAPLPGIFEVYLPLLFSPDFRQHVLTLPFYEKWHQRITFYLGMDLLNPFRLPDQIIGR
ncbi:MAG: M1 family metallopeptidase [Chitinophagales bacterium]|nr:M1 family metallopeptidase [Chitinophagales bacterium]MDW8393703.1 M1 family metallopeptidase [Chitinophagales bacterium]